MVFCVVVALVVAPVRAQERGPSGDIDSVAALGAPSRFAFNGLLQVWYLTSHDGSDDTFQIRRAELKFGGHASRAIAWTIMVDPAKALPVNSSLGNPVDGQVPSSSNQVVKILQDAFITVGYHPRLTVTVGQFKVPLSREGLQSSAELDTERALFMTDRRRGGTYGDVRDVGVMASGSLSMWLDYQFGVFDGGEYPQNVSQRHSGKAVAGRIGYRPGVLSGLQLGTSGLRENSATTSEHTRFGAELLYRRGPLTFTTEYMTGKDGSIMREGYYTHLAYSLASKWSVSLRYDTWDPDTHLEGTPASVTERDYIAGVNYLIDGSRTKLQFNYLRKTFEHNLVASFNQAVIRLQTTW
jgi:hypothetical protein